VAAGGGAVHLAAGTVLTPLPRRCPHEHGSIGGAQYRVEVPEHWNGTLLLWSHGLYPPGFLPDEIQLTNKPATKGWLLDHGYAVAASNFRTPDGWAVKEALGDTEGSRPGRPLSVEPYIQRRPHRAGRLEPADPLGRIMFLGDQG
jgi:hypothetical protein